MKLKENPMQNYIGGLFKREEDAGTALQALRRAGFSEESITLLARKPQAAPVHKDRVQAPAVGRKASDVRRRSA